MNNNKNQTLWITSFVKWLLAFALLYIIFRSAWCADDSYIIFRSLDQFYAGNGPNWNSINRVQVYTSPLWYWLLATTGIFIKDVYLNAIVVSLLCSAACIAYMAYSIKNLIVWGMLVASLAVSNAFVDFSTSGLENPLIFLLCILFFGLQQTILSRDLHASIPSRKILMVYVLAGLLLVTRHDLIFIVLPCILYFGYRVRSTTNNQLKHLIITVAPLAAWTVFSLFYYGRPLPNTAYAKLGTHVAHLQVIEQGLMYIVRGITSDFMSIFSIVIAAVLLIRQGGMFKVIVFCAMLIFTYIIWIGGDFMVGRFYAHVMLLLLFALAQFLDKQYDQSKFFRPLGVAYIVAMLFYGCFYVHTPINSPAIYHHEDISHGISDERGFYSHLTSIWLYIDHDEPYFPAYLPGQEDVSKPYDIRVAVGMSGYFKKHEQLLIDNPALTDIFLATMPRDRNHWQLAHSPRYIPENYPESLLAGKPLMKDPYLNTYFEKIYNINQSPNLFAWERLEDIIFFNLGYYDHYLEEATLPHFEAGDSFNAVCQHSWKYKLGAW